MLVSLRWLNQIFSSGLGVDQILDTLTMAGLEIENSIDLGMRSGKIVVAKALEVTRHPDADKLSLVKTEISPGKIARIVCGAPNVREGTLYPCALPGAELPDGNKIRKSKIRGQESEGMLCSARELGMGGDHSGILDLPETYAVGEPFDFLMDIKVTPNRADCLSVVGVARDLAAMVGKKKTFPTTYRFTETLGQTTDQFIKVEVEQRDACPRYTCRYLKTVRIGASPLWMTRALEASGLRSINNIVDVTNYVMLELGIPLHAFDYATIAGAKIIVRYARAGETLVTLDDRVLELHPDDLVIADAERPIALAGVMGGKNTQVTPTTASVVLECAYFDPAHIRRTARRHGLQTDSGYRFERGVDRGRVQTSLARATQLLQDVATATIVRGFIDVHAPIEEAPPISLKVAHLNHLLGLKLTNAEVADRLVDLGFEIKGSDRESLSVVSPSYRIDISADVDLIEEVARVFGYDRIPETMPGIVPKRRVVDGRALRIRSIRTLLANLGFSEAIHYSFVGEEDFARHGLATEAQPQLKNPLTIEQSILRASLVPQLLKTAAYNQRQGLERIALFELGKVFKPNARPGHEEDEGLSLGLVMTGPIAPPDWGHPQRPTDFFDLKGIVETMGCDLGLGELSSEGSPQDHLLHPGRSASASWQRQSVGFFGEVDPNTAALYDLRGRVYVAELDLNRLLDLAAAQSPKFNPLPRYPSSERDLAVIVDQSIKADQLRQSALKAGRPLVEELAIVDVYTGAPIPGNKKSLALRFTLRSTEATLTEEQISGAMDKILASLEKECGATLRT